MRISNNFSNYQQANNPNFKAILSLKFYDGFKRNTQAKETIFEAMGKNAPLKTFCEKFNTYISFHIFKGDNNLIYPRMYFYYHQIPTKPPTPLDIIKQLSKIDERIVIDGDEVATIEEAAKNMAEKISKSDDRFLEEMERYPRYLSGK